MTNSQLLMALSTIAAELACYKAEHGELKGQTEYRCAFCAGSVFGPAQLDTKLGPPAHSECLLKQQLDEQTKNVVALCAQLAEAEKD